MKDLDYYAAAIKSYINSTLRKPEQEVPPLNSVLGIIRSLREVNTLCMQERCKNKRNRVMLSVRKRESERPRIPWEITFERYLTKSSLVLNRIVPPKMQRETRHR